MEKYLFNKSIKSSYRILDFGCGAGLSTKLFSEMIANSGYQAEFIGIDISEENLERARSTLPCANYIKIQQGDKLHHLGEFDLIICNFVLVEMQETLMKEILSQIQFLLTDTGIAIITNCANKAYKKSNKWYTFNNDFSENEPAEIKDGKLKFKEDQPIKVQVYAGFSSDLSFTVLRSLIFFIQAQLIARLISLLVWNYWKLTNLLAVIMMELNGVQSKNFRLIKSM